MSEQRVAAGLVVVAAGKGTRLGAGIPKAFVEVAGHTILEHALRHAWPVEEIRSVVVVAPATHLEQARGIVDAVARGVSRSGAGGDGLEGSTAVHEEGDEGLAAAGGAPAVGADVEGAGESARVSGMRHLAVVPGGAERTDSVAAGMAALGEDIDIVLVHDAARCMTPAALFRDVIARIAGGEAAVVPGLAVTDTIKVVDTDGHVTATPDRAGLRAVQTPQGFRWDVLEAAHELVRTGRAGAATDDAALVELLGERVLVVPGDAAAHKVTGPQDLERVSGLRSH